MIRRALKCTAKYRPASDLAWALLVGLGGLAILWKLFGEST